MISLCIPTFNRTDLLFESFAQVLDDDRISEIVIVDDHSDPEKFYEIVMKYDGIEKVKIYRNEKNLDCYRNKHEAVKMAKNEWVILFDSDNVLTKEYLDSLDNRTLWRSGVANKTLYQPSFAKPHFNFTEYATQSHINKMNVKLFINNQSFQTMLNAMNFFINRDEYLRVWDGSVDPVTSDSLYFNYCWLKAGNSIYVVPGLEYEHRVNSHGNQEPSHYSKHHLRTPRGFHESIIQKLKEMK